MGNSGKSGNCNCDRYFFITLFRNRLKSCSSTKSMRRNAVKKKSSDAKRSAGKKRSDA